MKRLIKLNLLMVAAAFAAGAFAACSPSNPRLMAPPGQPQPLDSSGVVPPPDLVNHSLDVLFVVDPSYSMEQNGHLENLAKNVSSLGQAIAGKLGANADVRFAVVRAWDAATPSTCPYNKPGQFVRFCQGTSAESDVLTAESKGCDGKGTFIDALTASFSGIKGERSNAWVKDVNGQEVLTYDANDSIKRNADGSAIVRAGCGPEDEQLFTPVMAALGGGFVRDGATLAIVWITDANVSAKEIDAQLDASAFVAKIRALKKGDARLVSLYAVMSLGANCGFDDYPVSSAWWVRPAAGRARVGNATGELGYAVWLAGGKKFDLCSDTWSKNLAEIGAGIGKFTVEKTDRVSAPAFATDIDLNNTQVSCATSADGSTKSIGHDFELGWSYDVISKQVSVPMSVLRTLGCSSFNVHSYDANGKQVQR